MDPFILAAGAVAGVISSVTLHNAAEIAAPLCCAPASEPIAPLPDKTLERSTEVADQRSRLARLARACRTAAAAADAAATAAKKGQGPQKIWGVRPDPGVDYRIRVIKPDATVDYKIQVIRPDPTVDYKILVIDPLGRQAAGDCGDRPKRLRKRLPGPTEPGN